MAIGRTLRQNALRMTLAVTIMTATSLAIPKPAQAVDAGTAVGIGLGAAALGAAVGSTATPYNNGYYYPPGYAYPGGASPGLYPAAPYYPTRSCWDPYRRYYYAC